MEITGNDSGNADATVVISNLTIDGETKIVVVVYLALSIRSKVVF